MGKNERKRKQIFGLVIALVVVLFGGVLFMGAISGWFEDGRVELDDEYYCAECGEEFTKLSNEGYEELIKRKASFIVFVDQDGCKSADKLRGFMQRWAKANSVKVQHMMFGDVKATSLHEVVKFYPSVAIVSKGHVMAWLRADEEEDVGAYNNYDDFTGWIEKYLIK